MNPASSRDQGRRVTTSSEMVTTEPSAPGSITSAEVSAGTSVTPTHSRQTGQLAVRANGGGEAREGVAAERSGINGDAREVDEDAPEVTALFESRIERCELSIGVEDVDRHR